MTTTPLLDEDRYYDAGDCAAAWEAGTIALCVLGVDFGDNSSTWAYDGECDDSHFTGLGVTSTALLNQDMYQDATDCHRAYVVRDIWLC